MSRLGELINNQKSPKSPSSPATSYENEKNRKYDRQLRIWGDYGQYLIEGSSVCLINANATGTEILKNLVLAGIGSFTIIDGSKVSTEDDNNFFCDPSSSLGKSRASVSCQMLLELNPDVSGDYFEESVETLIESNPSLFKNFTTVVASNVHNEKTLAKLSEITWHYNIPLILAYSIGFVGLIRVQVREHPVIEAHPDNTLEDLRLDKPFRELKEYFESFKSFEDYSRSEVSQIPFVVIIYKFLKLWQTANGKTSSCLPSSFKEKEEIRKLIRESMKTIKQSVKKSNRNNSEEESTENVIESEIELENFEEAIKSVNTVLISSEKIPKDTLDLLNDPILDNLADSKVENSSFWLLVRALKLFLSQTSDGCLPVRGSLPDMSADTTNYVKLQQIYQTKAREDVETLYSCLTSVCNSFGKSMDAISEEQVKTFCRNLHFLKVIRTSPIWSEFSSLPGDDKNYLKTSTRLRELINCSDFNGDESDDLIFYLMFRAISRFYTLYNRYPGYCDDLVESDISTLKSCFKDIINDLGCTNLSKDDFIHEMSRYGGAELHSISAFIGGCAAQEVIKFITKQFIPLNSILIYNSMSSKTSTYLW